METTNSLRRTNAFIRAAVRAVTLPARVCSFTPELARSGTHQKEETPNISEYQKEQTLGMLLLRSVTFTARARGFILEVRPRTHEFRAHSASSDPTVLWKLPQGTCRCDHLDADGWRRRRRLRHLRVDCSFPALGEERYLLSHNSKEEPWPRYYAKAAICDSGYLGMQNTQVYRDSLVWRQVTWM
ncbi:oncomodulin-1 isoform X2 [Pongo pygmaeus]|uniref:oncomodulin-1 isoform X2 n=1 Tax=Pongo pygmaeus TaxID=9600 RepID=UPI0023E31D5A|nr:oncomodulin-1 isoform X2 [Pongo pygmaeus]